MDLYSSWSSDQFDQLCIVDQATKAVRKRVASTKPKPLRFHYHSSIIVLLVLTIAHLLNHVAIPELCPPTDVAPSSPNFELLTELLTSVTTAIDSYPEVDRIKFYLNRKHLSVKQAGSRLQGVKLGSSQRLGEMMVEISEESVPAVSLANEWSAQARSLTQDINNRLDVMSQSLFALDDAQPSLLENLQEAVRNKYCRNFSEECHLSSQKRAALEEIFLKSAHGIELLPEILVLGDQFSESMQKFRRKSFAVQAEIEQEMKTLSELETNIMSTWLAWFGLHDTEKVDEITTALEELKEAHKTIKRFNEPLLNSRFTVSGNHLQLEQQLKQLHFIEDIPVAEHIVRVHMAWFKATRISQEPPSPSYT